MNFYTYVFDSPTNLTDPSGNCPFCPGAAAGTTATAAEVDAVVAPLVEGAATDMGLGATFGVAVETGSAGGAIGVAAVAGWGIGRLVGNMPMPGGGGATVDDGWTGIWGATLFKPDPDPLPGATPLLKNLAGRQCKDKGNDDGDDCDTRYEKEKDFCSKEFGGTYRNLYRLCMKRAFWRWNNCKRGMPDPGPLDPTDPNWSME